MEFDKIFNDIEFERLNECVNDITFITHNSKNVKQDYCYICLIGKEDGHNFIRDAIVNGAMTIVVQSSHALQSLMLLEELGVSNIVTLVSVKDTRSCYGLIAGNYYAHPDRDIKLIGVTGTNGKTTTCKIIYDILRRLGYRTGLIGTVCNYIGSDKLESAMTTPDPMKFNELLRAMVSSGCEYVVTEVSAHAIYLRKIEGCSFAALGFTNLSQDHLDFFGTMDKYKSVKKSLFINTSCPITVNIDDGCGREMYKECNRSAIIGYYVINECRANNNCGEVMYNNQDFANNTDIYAVLNQKNSNCDCFDIVINDNSITAKSGLQGKFNVYNALCAIGVLKTLGFDEFEVINQLQQVTPPAGRFEMRDYNGIKVIIDYAHTPDGMEKVLSETRDLTKGKVMCVFGCGGNRDKFKRPIMGSIAEKYADKIIITSDNPRDEDRIAIIEDIYKGITNVDKVVICAIRYHAILYAYKCAAVGDTIVVLGKGHENYIEENGIKIEYSDIESIERIMGFEWNTTV